MKLKYTRQFDQMDCGPACIRMVASAYGRTYPLSYLRTLSHLTREGVSVAGIRDALKVIGMESVTFEMTLDQLEEKCPLPAILHWEQNHFVVLYEVKRNRWTNKRTFYIANPAYGRHGYDEKDMEKCWLNGDSGIVVAIEPTDDFYRHQEVKEKHSLLKFGQKYVWPFKNEMVQLSMGLLSGLVLSLVTPFLTQALVDQGIGMRDFGIITTLLVAQLSLFVGSFTMGMVSSWVSLYMGTRISIRILHDYLAKLMKLPMTFFETKSVGDYQQRIGDHYRLQSFTTQGSMQTLFSLLTGMVLSVIIGFYSWKILLFYLGMTGLSALWMSYFFRKRKALDYEQFKLNARNQNKVYELMTGITDIKLNAYDGYKVKEWETMQEELYAMSQNVLRLDQIQNTGYTVIGQTRNILVTFWIAVAVVSGDLTLGMMMSISTIIGQIDGPLSQLITFLRQLQDAKISLERSEEVHLCENEDRKDGIEVPTNAPRDIELKDVTFGYIGNAGKPVLKNISIKIPAGKTTAIVGESGSGKTTLMKLLLKFYEPTKGCILLDGKDLRMYKAESLRQASGIVMQDNFVFSDTLKNNITLGETYDEQRMKAALEAACLKEYVEGLPLGINTKIGAEGNGISGGERQRIMIARAMYKHPMYMLLDEATSSLDAENERKITENLRQEFAKSTVVVIAHRLSTVRHADNIVVLKHGLVAEQGTHEELVALKGVYYNLVKNQLELARE